MMTTVYPFNERHLHRAILPDSGLLSLVGWSDVESCPVRGVCNLASVLVRKSGLFLTWSTSSRGRGMTISAFLSFECCFEFVWFFRKILGWQSIADLFWRPEQINVMAVVLVTGLGGKVVGRSRSWANRNKSLDIHARAKRVEVASVASRMMYGLKTVK